MGYVRDSDVKAVTVLPDLKEDEEEGLLEDDWDLILGRYLLIYLRYIVL
jgi:hypothetical protein